jgi:SulP family sulfate permease
LTAIIAASALAILILVRKFAPKVPSYLLVCVLGTLASWLFNFEAAGVSVVGDIPTGMPTPALPDFDFSQIADLIPVAISIVIVGYASSITVVKALAAKERDSIRPNRELWAFGLANLASGLFGAFPVSAGLARTTVAAQSGARTQLTGVVASLTVVLVLFLLAPVFRFLPQPVLASIIIMAASRLIDVRGTLSVFRTKRNDGLTALLAFFATLALGLEEGLAVGLLMALVFFVARSTRPHSAELGRIPGSMVYRNTKRFEVETCPQVGILRIDAPLYYANARFLEDRINEMFAQRPDMSLLALDCASVNDMDATAVQSLQRVITSLRARGNDIHLIAVIGPVRDLLTRSGLAEVIGEENMHRSLLEAAPTLMTLISRETCETRCRAAAFPDCSLIPRRSDASESARASRFTPQI